MLEVLRGCHIGPHLSTIDNHCLLVLTLGAGLPQWKTDVNLDNLCAPVVGHGWPVEAMGGGGELTNVVISGSPSSTRKGEFDFINAPFCVHYSHMYIIDEQGEIMNKPSPGPLGGERATVEHCRGTWED